MTTSHAAERIVEKFTTIIADVATTSAARKGTSPEAELDAATEYVFDLLRRTNPTAYANVARLFLAAGLETPHAA